jgi:sulfoquinovosyltransferase
VVPPTGALLATTLPLETEGDSALTLDAAGITKKRPRPMDMWREMDRSKLVPKRIGLMVEPTPFTHVSGYSNRFNEMLKHLQSTGDVVEIVVPDNSKEAPATAHGFKVNNIPGFKFAMYPLITLGKTPGKNCRPDTIYPVVAALTLTLTHNAALDTRMRALYAMKNFKPDLLHVTTPSFLVFPGILVARILGIPLVLSYHTHLPVTPPPPLIPTITTLGYTTLVC